MNHAHNIIEALKKEIPEGDGAFSEDETTFGFDWSFKDGSKLWLDFDVDGAITILWKQKGMEEPFVASITTKQEPAT